jgi:hypothetical protein
MHLAALDLPVAGSPSRSTVGPPSLSGSTGSKGGAVVDVGLVVMALILRWGLATVRRDSGGF